MEHLQCKQKQKTQTSVLKEKRTNVQRSEEQENQIKDNKNRGLGAGCFSTPLSQSKFESFNVESLKLSTLSQTHNENTARKTRENGIQLVTSKKSKAKQGKQKVIRTRREIRRHQKKPKLGTH